MVHHLHRVGQSVLKVVSRRLQLRWTCIHSFGFVRIWPQFMQSCVCILSVYSLDKHRAVIWNICVIASVVFTDSTSQWRPNDTHTHTTPTQLAQLASGFEVICFPVVSESLPPPLITQAPSDVNVSSLPHHLSHLCHLLFYQGSL